MKKDEFDKLLQGNNLDDITNYDALNLLGLLIDDASDTGDATKIERAFSWCDQLRKRKLNGVEEVRLYYREANGWAVRRHISINDTNQWAWDCPELLKELFHLRLAIKSESFDKLEAIEKCQIYVNAANTLNTLGRFVEALEVWNKAIEIIPKFGMAHGNIGLGLMSYAGHLYDSGHESLMMKFAYDSFSFASSSEAFFESDDYNAIKVDMRNEASNIKRHIDLEMITNSFDLNGYSLGFTKDEKNYRQWCLSNCLFLNPLNDLGGNSIAASDVFGLPSITLGIEEAPSLFGFFNQMKQEYVSARYMYYEGISSEAVHFSDVGVLLYNTLDYPTYSLATERVKAAFSLGYSIFDKIAYFINAYWSLGIQEDKVNFRSVWVEKKEDKSWELRSSFEVYENLPMRGLYWLSKDILNNHSYLKDTTEPDAKALKKLRNHLEHKYLKVHDLIWEPDRYSSKHLIHLKDDLSFSIKKNELEEKSLRVLKLARSALIYLSLAVYREETLREGNNKKPKAFPVELRTFDDDWKR